MRPPQWLKGVRCRQCHLNNNKVIGPDFRIFRLGKFISFTYNNSLQDRHLADFERGKFISFTFFRGGALGGSNRGSRGRRQWAPNSVVSAHSQDLEFHEE